MLLGVFLLRKPAAKINTMLKAFPNSHDDALLSIENSSGFLFVFQNGTMRDSTETFQIIPVFLSPKISAFSFYEKPQKNDTKKLAFLVEM